MFFQQKSFTAQRRHLIFIAFCILAVILVVLVSNSSGPSSVNAKAEKARAAFVAGSKGTTTSPACCEGDEGDQKPHLLAGSYYTLKNGFAAKLLLNNKGPSAIEVKPTIFAMTGQHFEASPVIVAGNSYQFVNLADWAGVAGPQFQEGSVQLFHRGKDLVLGSQIYLTDNLHNLGFEEKLSEPANSNSSGLAGVWWLPTPKGDVDVVVSNTTSEAFFASIKVRGETPKREGNITIHMGPHETKLLDVGSEVLRIEYGAMSRFGAISVEHNGPRGCLLARAMAHEAAIGYSLPVQFSDPRGGKSTSLQGAGLRFGKIGDESLSPKVVAHNAGETETTLTGRVQYTTIDGNNGMVALPQLQLSPGQTELIDVAQSLRAHNIISTVAAASLEFEYTGQPGRVITSAFSVSGNGDQVFRVPLWDIVAQRSATGGYPWYIEGDSYTVVFIKNVTDEPRQYTLQLRYDGGVYATGLKMIGPRQTVALDIRALRDQQVADQSGHTLPREATHGQVNWSMRGPQNQVLIGRSEQVDLTEGVSSNYACQNCCPDSFSGGWIDPGDAWLFGGDVRQFNGFEQTVNCYGSPNAPFDPWPSFDSTDWGVMGLCGGAGEGTADGPGSAFIQARWVGYEWGSFESGNPNECYPRERSVLVEAFCNVTGLDVPFTTVSLLETNRSAEFLLNRAVLNVNTDTGPSACGGDMFWIRARFDLPEFNAGCCSGPNNFVRLDNNNQFSLVEALFFENESRLSGFVDIRLRRVNSGAQSNKVNIHIHGTFQNGDTYRGLGVVRLTCS